MRPPRPASTERALARLTKRVKKLEHRGPSPWHDVGASGEPAFQGTWTAEGGATIAPRFRWTLGAGLEIQGAFAGGTYGTVAFTLPADYRPEGTLYLEGSDSDNNPVTFKVEATGDVTIYQGGIADGTVTTNKIVDLAVTTAKLADGAVTDAKLSTTGVSPGTYGDASHVAQVTVNAEGRITGAVSTAIAIAEAAVTGLVADLAAKINAALFTTKGDVLVATAPSTPARLGVGTDGQVLEADSTQPAGVKWVTPSSGSVSPLTTKGDLWGFDTANDRVPVGADGQVLTADSTAAPGVSWKTPSASGIVYAPLTNPATPDLIFDMSGDVIMAPD